MFKSHFFENPSAVTQYWLTIKFESQTQIMNSWKPMMGVAKLPFFFFFLGECGGLNPKHWVPYITGDQLA